MKRTAHRLAISLAFATLALAVPATAAGANATGSLNPDP
jgi:hypothetical protein